MTNGSPDYKLGQLSSAVAAIQDSVGRLDASLARLDRRVDELRLWKSQILGMAAGVSFIVAGAMTVVQKVVAMLSP